jgi:hypothetical protein
MSMVGGSQWFEIVYSGNEFCTVVKNPPICHQPPLSNFFAQIFTFVEGKDEIHNFFLFLTFYCSICNKLERLSLASLSSPV